MTAAKLVLANGTAPGTPAGGYVEMYAKTDKHLYYKNDTGTEFPIGPMVPVVLSVNGQTGTVLLDTDDVPEGSSNLYYTDTRVRAALSGTTPISYNNLTGAISLTTVPITLGGSGQTTANSALNAFLPSQATHAGKVLQTDGTDTSWQTAGTGTVTNVTSADGSIDITSPTTTPDLSLSFPINAPNGSAAAPSYRFDSDTGMYSPGDGGINFATNGVQAVEITNNQEVIFTNTVTADDFIYPVKTANTFLAGPTTGAPAIPTFRTIQQGDIIASALPFPMNAPGGSAAAPSYNFTTDTGMFSPSSGLIAFSTNGVERMRIENNGPVNMFGDLTITGNFAAANFPTPITGAANTPTYYDNGGLLASIPGRSIDPANFIQTINLTSTADIANFTVDTVVYTLDIANTSDNITLRNDDLNINGTLTATARLYNGNLTGEAQDIVATNWNITANSINNLQLMNIGSTGSIGGNFQASFVGNFGPVTGQAFFDTRQNNQTIGNGLTFANWGNNTGSAITGQLRFLDWSNQSTVSNNLSGLFLNSTADIAGQLDFLSLSIADDVGTNVNGMSINIQNTATIGDSITGMNLNNAATFTGAGNQLQMANINNTATGDSLRAFSVANNATLDEEFSGFRINNSGNVRTGTGIDIIMSGNATDDTQGIRVNVNSLTSTNNRVRSMDIQGATWSFNNLYRPASGLFVDSGNNNFTEFRIANGSPVTNTDVLMNNNIVAYLAEDSMALGPVGLGIATTNSISLLGVADTKQIDVIRGLLVVASVQNPGYADNGTVDFYEGIVYAGALAGGGNTVINNAVGLIMPTGFDGYAGTNFGMRIQGTTAENYINKLAIGTASNTAAAGLLLDTNGQIGITSIGSGLSIAEGANAKMGTAVLVAGVVTVSTTAVTASSRIFVTNQAAGGVVGALYISNIVAGTSFDINSTSVADTSTIAWEIIEAI